MKRTAALRQALLDKRAEILKTLGVRFDTVALMGRVAEDDQAQISHDEFISLQVNSIGYEKLRLVDEALERLDAGDFGFCLECENPIPEKRLRAIPWARYCVSCQEKVAQRAEAAGRFQEPELIHS